MGQLGKRRLHSDNRTRPDRLTAGLAHELVVVAGGVVVVVVVVVVVGGGAPGGVGPVTVQLCQIVSAKIVCT